MDDTRTQDTLDALADLFLTGQGDDSASPASDSPAPSAGDGASGLSEGDDPLAGPEPYRLRPKPAAASRWARQVADDDASPTAPRRFADSSAEYAGGGGSDQGRMQSANPGEVARDPLGGFPEAGASVEAVLLGNLPGIAGPWLTQYAQLLADRDGPVAMVHIDSAETGAADGRGGGEGGLEIELVQPQPSVGESPRDLVQVAEASDPLAVLDSLLRDGKQPVGRVLVHLDTRAEPGGLDRLGEIGVWTLLGGADDAAVAAAGSILRRLVGARPALGGCRVGLAIMGAEPSRAHAAAERIVSEAAAMFHTPVELVATRHRMTPVHVRELGRFNNLPHHWPALRDYLQALPEPGAGDERGDQAHAEGPDATVTPGRSPGVGREQKAEPPTFRASQTADASNPTSDPPPRPPDQPATDPPDLAALLTANPLTGLAGAVALEARCPHQPQVQLLLDQSGHLHLLRRHTCPDPQRRLGQGPDPQLRAALLDLMEARHWVTGHLELLRLTQRQGAFDMEAPPTLHLFTDRADLASGIASRLGDHLRPHLLQRVVVGDTSTWFSTPLG